MRGATGGGGGGSGEFTVNVKAIVMSGDTVPPLVAVSTTVYVPASRPAAISNFYVTLFQTIVPPWSVSCVTMTGSTVLTE